MQGNSASAAGNGGVLRGLAEAGQRGGFIRLYVEDHVEARDLQNVADAFREIDEFQLAARAADGRVRSNQLADAGAVDIIDVVQIEQDLAMPLVEQLADYPPEHCAAFAQRDFAAEIHHDDVARLTACSL